MGVAQIFIYLQLLDLLTTLVGFRLGASIYSGFHATDAGESRETDEMLEKAVIPGENGGIVPDPFAA